MTILTAAERASVHTVLRGEAHHTIVDAEARLRAAQLAGDVAALDALIADDLLFTGPDGALWSKAADLQSHRDRVVRFLEHVPESLEVRSIADGIALTAMRARLTVAVSGVQSEGLFCYSRVWARTGEGSWRVMGGHVSQVPGAG
jgi:ketosteroid isomerase-like protein